MTLKHLISSIVALVLTYQGVAAEALGASRLQQDSIKVFWQLPIAGKISADNSWFRIARCQEPGVLSSCTETVDVIPVKKVLSRGKFSIQFDADGTLMLLFRDRIYGDSPVIVATQSFSEFWFPQTEICQFKAAKAHCLYTLDLDVKTRNLNLSVYFKKEGEKP